MSRKNEFRWSRCLRRVLGVAVCGAGTLCLLTDAGAVEFHVGETESAVRVVGDFVVDEAGWNPDEVRVPGKRPEQVEVGPISHPLRYFDARGVERTSVLVYLDERLPRQAIERIRVRNFVAQERASVHYEYTTAMPNVLNLRDVPARRIEALKQLPGVVKVELDEYHPDLVKLDESTPLIRALQSQLTAASLPYDGTGVRVCIGDTGIDMDHIMYSTRIDTAASYDFANNDSNPDDDHGHGSHVAGIAVGGTGLSVDFGCEGSEPFQGIAPNATLIGVKILNSAGGGTDSDIIAGIDHCADQSPSGGRADVINLSIGTGNYAGICTHSWAVACNNAVANGVVVVAASGNENRSNSMGSPACGVNVIAVGATYKDDYPNCEDSTSTFNWSVCTDSSPARDSVVCFSNESDYLDVTAPGSVIMSASNAAGGSSIVGMSGTSMASPVVTGLAALILDADPSLTPAEVRQVIRDGAIDMGPAGFDRAYGYGRVDAINSLSLISPCGTNGDCDDGAWCNGAETCNAGSCQPGSDPCPGQSCDEVTDSCIAAPILQIEWNMNTNPGWTIQGQWAWGTPTGGGGQHAGPDPTGGATGSNVYGYNLAGDYANNLAETHLTTTAIDCSNYADVSVKFQRWLGVEQPAYDHAYFRVSNNGTIWTQLWTNGAEVGDTSWSQRTFDISAYADGQPTVYLRWTMGTTDSSWQYCGWNIDDVQIWASSTGSVCTVNADCDDGAYCNGAETCVGGACQAGTAVVCNDGVGCTTDSCNEGTDSCVDTPNNGACDDGLWCNGTETCHATLDCQSGTAPNCNDGVDCTTDSCNESTDSCQNTPNNNACSDGVWCNGTEICHTTLDCQSGTAPNCTDGIGCTTDSCNEATDSCDHVTNDSACDDGLWCTGTETCHATLDCQAGTAPNCNDGVGCTTDSCNESTDSCDHVTNDAACDDGLWCTGTETCDAALDCQAGSDPCPGQGCEEVTPTCTSGECSINADCDDTNACTIDTCNASVCTNACSDSVSSFPYAENFSTGLGLWRNVTADNFDWTRDANGTPSSGTGPSGDHTTGSGYYMYTETSSPRVAGDIALLDGPCFDFSGASSAMLEFWYHMYGASMGTLQVDVSTNCTAWTNVFSLSGNKGNTWFMASIDLTSFAGSSTLNIRFRGIRSSSYQGDMAIDDISITTVAGSNCTTDADCADANVCTDDACVGSICQYTNNTSACDDGLFCNGAEVCSGGVCMAVTNPGVANGTFDGGASWTSAPAGGTITFPGNLNVVGPNAGSAAFAVATQSGVTVNGANLEFDLLSYSSADTGAWDYPVFHLNGTYYGLNTDGTLGAATTGGTGGAGTVNNGTQVASAIHYVVNIDALAGSSGPHTVGFGVHTADGAYGGGTVVFDTVLPAGGPIDPCPGQTCDEVNDMCVP